MSSAATHRVPVRRTVGQHITEPFVLLGLALVLTVIELILIRTGFTTERTMIFPDTALYLGMVLMPLAFAKSLIAYRIARTNLTLDYLPPTPSRVSVALAVALMIVTAPFALFFGIMGIGLIFSSLTNLFV